jgi:hypothetical protein
MISLRRVYSARGSELTKMTLKTKVIFATLSSGLLVQALL